MKQNAKSRKLLLSKETLRGLSAKELSVVRGANDSVRTCRTCGPPTSACPPTIDIDCLAIEGP